MQSMPVMTTSWLSRIMDLSPTAAAAAGTKFYGDQRFVDFAIICNGKKFKVHRIIICSQSKWFEACCAGSFLEAADRTVELHEDVLTAVDAMIEFFYRGSYCSLRLGTFMSALVSPTRDIDPRTPTQLHAHVYATAEKYDCPKLKQLALENFRAGLKHQTRTDMEDIVKTVYQHIKLPETDRVLRDTLLLQWVIQGRALLEPIQTKAFLMDVPEFAAELAVAALSRCGGNQ